MTRQVFVQNFNITHYFTKRLKNVYQVRIQDLCKGGAPTSRSGVAAAAKTWAYKLGVEGGGRAPRPLLRSAPGLFMFLI